MEADDDTPETGSIAALRMAAAVPAGSFCSLSVSLSGPLSLSLSRARAFSLAFSLYVYV